MGAISPLDVQILASILFALGMGVVIARRNIFFVLMGVELMLNAVNLSFVGFGRMHGDIDGYIVPLFVIAIAAAEACVGLAMVIALVRSRDSVDSDSFATMKE